MRLVWLAPVVLSFSLACGSGGGPAPGAGGPPPATKVKVWTAAGSALATEFRAVGTVDARESVDLRVEATGAVASVAFEDGATVAKGDVLLRLRQDAERARLDDAAAREKLAASKLDRVRSLFERQNAARQELEQAEAEHALAVAAVDLARDALRKTELRAPFAGVVGAREVSVGAMVGPTTPITRLDDLSELLVAVDLPERALADVQVGDPADVTVDAAPGRVFSGTVSFVGARVAEASRTVPVRVTLAPDAALHPGATAEVVVKASENAAALLVPTQAVVATANGPALWVVGEGDKAERLAVVTGARGTDTIEIVSGLGAGQRVIVEGLVRLQPGAAVAVVP